MLLLEKANFLMRMLMLFTQQVTFLDEGMANFLHDVMVGFVPMVMLFTQQVAFLDDEGMANFLHDVMMFFMPHKGTSHAIVGQCRT